MNVYFYYPSIHHHFLEANAIQDSINSHQISKPLVMQKEVSWEKPPSGWWKLNTDGCCKGNPGQSSGGGVIRQEDGCWIGGFWGSIGYSTSIEAELWAIQEGIRLGIMKGATHLVIETDCLNAINMIQDHKWYQEHPIIQQIRMLVKSLTKYEFHHVYREGNKVADFLANLGFYKELQYFDIAPHEVTELVIKDSLSFVYLRTK